MSEIKRIYFFVSAMLLSIFFLIVMWVFMPEKPIFTVLFGQGTNGYPYSIHNLMWVILFVGFGELVYRLDVVFKNKDQLKSNLLPEDDHTVLTVKELGPFYKKLKACEHLPMFLPKMVLRVITQFQTSKSVEQAQNLLNISIDLVQHEMELKYNMLRYLMWLIPTLGFIGTVLGISSALMYAGTVPPDSEGLLTEVTLQLGVAFHTTLLALIMSGVLMFLMNIIQSMEERVMNDAGQYCLDNLINRLYNEKNHAPD
ncbi:MULTISPECIES: MotA/TolQ/ExbB proton channel family protein [Nitrincola]|uniref:MotA/TolQ/ExbB proton channel family protein n=1 Tax=Nitrincola nitratireducens TaxID=1229521 RepID=W9VEE6_9GAMM|nr:MULTISPECIES: MotA/TolQ/ExbB proton channel family protein [Nitrincola]EXJ09085.1 MotA/TolQ/ExbB proton channel family protein [Nitrincola nitratireducens]